MRHSKLFIAAAALLICAFILTAALAEGTLPRLWKSGSDLLFHTDNVTVTGEATFSLDGDLFKTAELNYVQDGFNSFYGLKLLTPWDDGSVRESGWTIIASEDEDIFVMEAYYPGTYKEGTDGVENSLLRRSVQLDALVELGGFLAGQVEPLLPEGAISVDGNTVHIKLNDGQIPDVAVSALNVAAGYLSDRWFSYSHDRNVEKYEYPYENYVTVTEALTDGTVRWALHDADVEITTDDQGRLAAVSGWIQVSSTFWDTTVREVEVRFSFTMTDYDESYVKPFDPADYNVELYVDEY